LLIENIYGTYSNIYAYILQSSPEQNTSTSMINAAIIVPGQQRQRSKFGSFWCSASPCKLCNALHLANKWQFHNNRPCNRTAPTVCNWIANAGFQHSKVKTNTQCPPHAYHS